MDTVSIVMSRQDYNPTNDTKWKSTGHSINSYALTGL